MRTERGRNQWILVGSIDSWCVPSLHYHPVLIFLLFSLFQEFRRVLKPDDILPLNKYIPYIRMLWIDIRSSGSECLTHLSMLQNPVLPQLRTLMWESGVDSRGLIFLLCPALRNISISLLIGLNIDVTTASSMSSTVLRYLPSLTPNLTSFTCYGRDLLSSSAALEVLPQLSQLEDLYLVIVDDELLLHLGCLPRLRSLFCCVEDSTEQWEIGPPRFAALEKLTIRGGLAKATRFVSHHISGCLKSITVKTNRPEDPLGISELAKAALGKHSNSLSSFGLEWEDNITSSEFPLSSLKPLYKCCRLEDLFVSSTGPKIIYEDDDIWEIAKAWPLLRGFIVVRYGNDDKKPTTTLDSLCAFAKHCPSIEYIALSLDASGEIPDWESSNPRADVHFKLRTLQVYNSPCGDVEGVFAFLDRMFARLEHLHVGYGSEERAAEDGWGGVIDRVEQRRRNATFRGH